ncbi:MAG: hypothetical protein ABFD29_04470 [Anaerolineaceae bacterium]
MNTSILPIIAASISFSVGVFFMFGYFLRFGDRKYLTYAAGFGFQYRHF